MRAKWYPEFQIASIFFIDKALAQKLEIASIISDMDTVNYSVYYPESDEPLG